MKKILTEIAYYLLLIPAGITYFLVDHIIRAKKESKKLPELRHQRKNTVYPDEQLSFNEWINHVFRQTK